MKLSDKIRILRRMKGWSQEELGNKLSMNNNTGISRQAVSDWENDKTEPKLDTIRDLASLFNVSYDILLNENIDLNENEILEQVIKESNKENNKTVRSIVYYFYYFRIKVKEYLSIPQIIIFGVLTIYSFLHIGENTLLYFLLMFIFEIFAIFGIINFSGLIYKLIKQYGRRAGCLTYDHLRIEAFDTLGTTIYVPIANIEYMRVEKHHKNYCGDVVVKIIERKEPFILKNVYKPITLVNTYYQIMGPDQGLDSIKL